MAATKPNPRRGDPEASEECRHSARISENPPPIMVETGLAGWGGRIRTSVWRNQNPPQFTIGRSDFEAGFLPLALSGLDGFLLLLIR